VPLAALAACSVSGGGPAVRRPLESAPLGVHMSGPSEAPVDLVAPVALGDSATARLVAVRLELAEGSVVVAIRDAGGVEIVSQRTSRLGENLVVLPVRSGLDRPELRVAQPKATGGVRVDLRAVDVVEVDEPRAAAEAARLASEFEAETGRLGNAEPPNLVPNSDFVEDDEVRGTPAEWVAYVPTSVDRAGHVLRAIGRPHPGRPVVATAPMRLVAGRRYRALCRVRLDRGAILFRATDFDEASTLVAQGSAATGDEVDLTLDFVAPEWPPAVRLRIDSAGDEEVDVSISEIQLELLP
jgi:hypothetical protein